MTIAGLYALAVSRGCEHLPIVIEYACGDDYYSLEDEPLEVEDIEYNNEKVRISISQWDFKGNLRF